MAFISVSSYTNRVSEGTELQGCQALKLEQLMYSHLANGCRQLAYMDYLIVLTSDLAHVMLVLKNTFTVLFTLKDHWPQWQLIAFSIPWGFREQEF